MHSKMTKANVNMVNIMSFSISSNFKVQFWRDKLDETNVKPLPFKSSGWTAAGHVGKNSSAHVAPSARFDLDAAAL